MDPSIVLCFAQVGAVFYQFLPFLIALGIAFLFVLFVRWMAPREPWATVLYVSLGVILLIVLAKCLGVW